MLARRSFVSSFASATGLFAAAAATVNMAVAQDSKQADAKRDKNLAAGEVEAKRLLVLMDRDKNGMVSRQEFMSFMEAEFNRLDVNKDGELDVKELTEFHVHGGVHR